MSLTDLGLHSLALIAYPGLVSILLLGLGAELGLGRLARQPAGAGPRLRLSRPSNLSLAGRLALLLAAVAATQLAAPFNPVPAAERSALLAAVCVAGAGWASWSDSRSDSGRSEREPGGLLLAQLGWSLALLGPAVAAGTFHPTAVAAIAVPLHLGLKAVAGLLYLLCLPAVLLRFSAPPVDWSELATRAALWLPACALGASVLLPPVGDDLAGILRFALETATIALAAAILCRLLPRGGRAYRLLLLLLAAGTLGLAAFASRLA
ncbi:MAG: hypothetical protein M3Y62_04250 [Candidatus Dormibacteraeota bacterium]|nr:hypothetical protein [Candidatus Dormibacteraeota bacterium]